MEDVQLHVLLLERDHGGVVYLFGGCGYLCLLDVLSELLEFLYGLILDLRLLLHALDAVEEVLL
jgi:hypothetical protein